MNRQLIRLPAEMEDYRALMEEHGQTIRGKAAVLEAIGSAHGWAEVTRLAKAGQVDQALKMVVSAGVVNPGTV